MKSRLRTIWPLQAFILMASAIYIYMLLAYIVARNHQLKKAALIRDVEEERLAAARNLLSDLNLGNKPFNYNTYLTDKSVSESAQLPGLTIAILAANRGTHEIDDYEPAYLTESIAKLMDAIRTDAQIRNQQYTYVNITICPTMDNVTGFLELANISPLLPPGSVKHRPLPLDADALTCQALLDAGHCLLSSLGLPGSANSYVLLLEDDVMNQPDLLPDLSDVLHHLYLVQAGGVHDVGAVQMLRDSLTGFRVGLALTSVVFTVLLAYVMSCCKISFERLVVGTIAVLLALPLVLLVSSGQYGHVWSGIGQSWFHGGTQKHMLVASPDPAGAATGACVLFDAHTAALVGRHLTGNACHGSGESGQQGVNKADEIYAFLRERGRHVYSVSPGLFQHVGLYSIYDRAVVPERVDRAR